MIDHDRRIIYVDNSTLGAFRACKEKGRLTSFANGVAGTGYRSTHVKASLGFGHAMHAALAAYYDALAGGYRDEAGNWQTDNGNDHPISPVLRAKGAFLRDLGHTGVDLPVNLESDERRSIERGLALIEAYIWRWRNEPYENIMIDGRPAVEVGFTYPLCEWATPSGDVYMICYCGYIDRIMQNTQTKRPVIYEFKTTTQGLSEYVRQCNPNNQITGYFPGAAVALRETEFLLPITECVWDCMFVSSRQPDMSKALKDRFWLYGVDITKDFARQTTMRSATAIAKFLTDTIDDAVEYCEWMFKSRARWPQNTGSCHSYGGCDFRDVCIMNGSTEYLETNFRLEEWNPAKRIAEGRR